MALTKTDFAAYIKQFNFRELFNDMGWNKDKTSQPVTIDNITYSLHAVAEKSGFKILVCNPTEAGTIPDYSTRKKIETKLTKLFQEHLIIFVDAKKQEQIWQLVVRQSGKPAKVTETRYHISQDPELLFQRAAGIFFEMDEEENITIVDVTKRVADNFHQNNEKVTKQFYESFKKQHTSFLSFIKGIEGKADKDWYASLMLNRLMFCYFIQKKGFLDNDKNYLRHKLNLCKEKKGKDKFYSFYRSFLLVLFHEGLNEPAQKEKIKIEIGKIPYLNGGLFDEHELEKSYEIDIDDKAFERIFDFFDQYEWHLDTRMEATGKDINPDVIGYIFEKYINDRAQMGAYYTKEDITDYISKNCIIPWLFDETARNYPKAFTAKGEIWKALQQSGDNYIYDAVKYGTDTDLPKNIQAGIKDVAKRTDWNKQATTDLGLPTEIWREVVERRNRYEEVKKKIESGEITAINDFITYNLNIRQFTQDIIENSDDPDFIRAFYKAIISVTIIDPTCGSGAFLFAAMNILEPLYHACIMRMRAFTEDEDRENEQEKKTFKNKYKYFREVLENIQSEQHPNLQYFIYKSIILNNLYGVDIMREAVEIAKLRLFLKLVATVEADYKKKNLGLEPLPDIDFNIRAGNSLIGFSTLKEAIAAVNERDSQGQIGLVFTEELNVINAIKEQAEVSSMAFERFKNYQQILNSDIGEFKKVKAELQERILSLNKTLNFYLAFQKGIESIQEPKYKKWLAESRPFHWFAEFYDIINNKGGFNIIIGNPPYVELKKIDYDLTSFKNGYSNLYTYCIERSCQIISNKGCFSMIVPTSLIGLDETKKTRDIIFKNGKFNAFSTYSIRPSKLFDGVDQRLCIFLSNNTGTETSLISSKYNHWYTDERVYLFENIAYADCKESDVLNRVEQVGSSILNSILTKLYSKKSIRINSLVRPKGKFKLYYHRSPRYWIRAIDFEPYFKSDTREQSIFHTKIIDFDSKDDLALVGSIINSNLFFLWFISLGNGRNITGSDVYEFPIGKVSSKTLESIKNIFPKLMQDYNDNSIKRVRQDCEFQEFKINLSKSIIDKLDEALATNYDFNEEELDFIINYEIKYRMGKELESEDEE